MIPGHLVCLAGFQRVCPRLALDFAAALKWDFRTCKG